MIYSQTPDDLTDDFIDPKGSDILIWIVGDFFLLNNPFLKFCVIL